MKPPPAPFPDPWHHWPDGCPHEVLAPLGVNVDSPFKDIYQAGFKLLERGKGDAAVRQACDTLRLLGKRLCIDAMLYDPEAAGDMLEVLDHPGDDSSLDGSIDPLIKFSWEF